MKISIDAKKFVNLNEDNFQNFSQNQRSLKCRKMKISIDAKKFVNLIEDNFSQFFRNIKNHKIIVRLFSQKCRF